MMKSQHGQVNLEARLQQSAAKAGAAKKRFTAAPQPQPPLPAANLVDDEAYSGLPPFCRSQVSLAQLNAAITAVTGLVARR